MIFIANFPHYANNYQQVTHHFTMKIQLENKMKILGQILEVAHGQKIKEEFDIRNMLFKRSACRNELLIKHMNLPRNYYYNSILRISSLNSITNYHYSLLSFLLTALCLN